MFEDSFLDSFMESHIGGWTADTESMYDDQEARDACCDPDGDWDQEDADDFQYDDGYYDEADERLENADLDFDQSDY
jgi:hypothetical protein